MLIFFESIPSLLQIETKFQSTCYSKIQILMLSFQFCIISVSVFPSRNIYSKVSIKIYKKILAEETAHTQRPTFETKIPSKKKPDTVVCICNLTPPTRREMAQTDESLDSAKPSRLTHRAEIQ